MVKKDGSKIKKYKSAYIFFSEEKSKEYKKINPNFSQKEVFKLIGKDWKSLAKIKKKKYYDLEEKSRKQFNECKIFNPYNYNKSKIVKKPKRYRTPFMIYLHENKKKIDKSNSVPSLKSLGSTWKNMSKYKKQIYMNKSEKDKERYKQELLIYMKSISKSQKNIK